MKLLIRAYLGMLKESRELDAIIADLVLAMGIIPISRPQVGARQGGVDIAAVGADTDGRQTLFLYVIKRGDITRGEWDGVGPQAVRPSLDEIQDTYLRSRVSPEHQPLPKKIVLCCGGDLRQEVQQNWAGYTQNNQRPRELEFELWNGDTLAALIEEHLLNENMLPPAARDQLRRAIALVGDPDYDLAHYYATLKGLLLDPFGAGHLEGAPARPRLKASLRTIALCLSILYRWADDDDNLSNALLAAERTLLSAWEGVRRARLIGDKDIVREYVAVYEAYYLVLTAYVNRMQRHYYVQDGLAAHTSEHVLVNETVFHELGVVALAGLSNMFMMRARPDDISRRESFEACADAVEQIVANNPCAASPCYDGHVIDICLAFILLTSAGKHAVASDWLGALASCLRFSFAKRFRFPVATDQFDDALELAYGTADEEKIKELRSMSWLLPTLAQWCVVLQREDLYAFLAREQSDAFNDVCFQLWHHDQQTDDHLWVGSAIGESGITESPIVLPSSISEFITDLTNPNRIKNITPAAALSSVKAGIPIIDLVACRHFRVPIPSDYWQPSKAGPEVPPPESASG